MSNFFITLIAGSQRNARFLCQGHCSLGNLIRTEQGAAIVLSGELGLIHGSRPGPHGSRFCGIIESSLQLRRKILRISRIAKKARVPVLDDFGHTG